MNTHLIPNRLPTPPPVRPNDFRLDLLDGTRVVGWITPSVIGFTGFANETEAAHAAWVAWRALDRRLSRRDGRRPVPIDTEPLRVVTENGGRTVYGSRDRVATLVAPTSKDSGAPEHGFELRLDEPFSEVEVRAKAHALYRTLRRSGVRWAMWAPTPSGPRPRTATVPAPAAVPDTTPGSPRELRDVAVSVVLLATAIVAVMMPGALAGIIAVASIVGLMILRLTMLHAGWPRRGLARARALLGAPALTGP